MHGLKSAILAVSQKLADWLDWPCPVKSLNISNFGAFEMPEFLNEFFDHGSQCIVLQGNWATSRMWGQNTNGTICAKHP